MKSNLPWHTKLSIIVCFLLVPLSSLKAADTLLLRSQYLSGIDTVLIFRPTLPLPACQPVLLLLPDKGQGCAYYSQVIDLQMLSDTTGWLIVCPGSGSDSWFIDSPADSTSKHASHIVKGLVPEVLLRYGLKDTTVFISGTGMGGHGAFTIYMSNPHIFEGAGNISGPVDLRPFSTDTGSFHRIFGPGFRDSFLRYSFSSTSNLGRIANTQKPLCLSLRPDELLESQYKDFLTECDLWGIPLHYRVSDAMGENYIAGELIWQFHIFRSSLTW